MVEANFNTWLVLELWWPRRNAQDTWASQSRWADRSGNERTYSQVLCYVTRNECVTENGSADQDEICLVVDDEVVGVLSIADASNAADMNLEDDWNPLTIHSTLS